MSVPDDISDGRWTFYDSWAAFPHNRVIEQDDRIVGEFVVGLTAPSGSTYGEFTIRFYEFHRHEHWRRPEVAARLEAFGESWRVIASNPSLLNALAAIERPSHGPAEIRAALLALGFEDRTEQLRGTHPSPCPTCRGKGVLDEIGADR